MAGRRRYRPSLDAAKDEALRACDFYNQRRQQRNLEAFLVHMSLAWHALFQALNERDGIDAHRTWDLPTALAQRFPDPANPVRVNLAFLLQLHERVARATAKAMSAIDLLVAGKTQSCIRNFESTLVAEFGTGESLANDLRFPVFLSSLTSGADGVPAARARAPRGSSRSSTRSTRRSTPPSHKTTNTNSAFCSFRRRGRRARTILPSSTSASRR